MMVDAAFRRYRIAGVVAVLSGVTWFSAGGCVRQSTYDAVVEEGRITKTELARALQEQKVLTRQVSDIELLNADVMREAEGAVAALQQTKDAAEQERLQTEQHISKLQMKMAQASKQHRSLQYELTVAKENTAALQELVDVYQRKVRDGAISAAAAPAGEPTIHKPFDPSTIPIPQDLPPAPAVTPKAPEPPPPTVPASAASAMKPTPPAEPPSDEGLITSLKNWLLYLWHSVFS